jgi:hypothetical protein
MTPRRLSIAGALWLAAGILTGQVPAHERIPITNPDRLEAMGFPRDARNVFVWSKADLKDGPPDAPGNLRPKVVETWGTGVGYTTVHGHELKSQEEGITVLFRQPPPYSDTECNGTGSQGAHAFAQIQVPDGASLDLFSHWAFDSASDQDLWFRVWETCQPYGYDPPTSTLIAENQTLAAVGDITGTKSLNNLTVNNLLCAYTVEAIFAPPGGECRFGALRVRKLRFSWNRQVSPAPATATFDDVPTNHPFFQFIEALSKSGTTAGCQTNPPQYCPDRPITRGEMAVYLAKALGLQWP